LCGARTFLPSFDAHPRRRPRGAHQPDRRSPARRRRAERRTFDTDAQRGHDGRVRMIRAFLRVFFFAAPALGGCGSTVSLHAPDIATSVARTTPARVEVEPIAMRRGA